MRKVFLIITVIILVFFNNRPLKAEEGKPQTKNLYSVDWGRSGFSVIPVFVLSDKPLEEHRLESGIKPIKNMLVQKKAEKYIGKLDEKLLSGTYTARVFVRNEMDAVSGRKTDGIVFNTGGGNFGFWKNEDGCYEFILDSEGGKRGETVTRETLNAYFNYIADENLKKTYVVFDNQGGESAILYLPDGTEIKQFFTDKGNVFLKIKAAGCPSNCH